MLRFRVSVITQVAFSLSLVTLSVHSPAVAASQSLCDDIILTSGSDLTSASPIYDVSGLPYKVLGLQLTLGAVCKWTAARASNTNVRLYVQGKSGKRYQVRAIFSEAATSELYVDALRTTQQTPVQSSAAIESAPVGDAWNSTLEPQYQLLTSLSQGHGSCDSLDRCPMHDALASAGPTAPLAPSHESLPMVQYDDRGTIVNGAVIDSCLSYLPSPSQSAVPSSPTSPGPSPLAAAPVCAQQAPPLPVSMASPNPAVSASPVPATIDDNTTLTLYLNKKSFTVLDLRQSLAVSQTLDYVVSTHVGTDVTAGVGSPSYQDYQLFTSEYNGPSLVFNESATQGKDFNFCPLDASIPIPGSPVPLTAELSCTGKADLAYNVSLTPTLGYFLTKPDVDIKLNGSLKANGGLVVGVVSADITIASFSGGTGGMYAILHNPLAPAETVLAYRDFAYYDASALQISLTAQIQTTFGATPYSKTFVIFKGVATSLSPMVNDWHAVRLL